MAKSLGEMVEAAAGNAGAAEGSEEAVVDESTQKSDGGEEEGGVGGGEEEEGAEESASTEDVAAKEDDETGGDDDPNAIREYAKSVLGDGARAWIDKYENDEEFLRAAHEQNKLIGQRNEDSQVMRYLKENGVTADDLHALVTSKSPGATVVKNASGSDAEEWDPAWITINANRQITPTAKAPPDIEAKIAKRFEMMFDDAKLAKLVAPHVTKDIEEKTKAERERDQLAAVARQEQHDFQSWADQNRKLLYVENSDTLTPIGRLVDQRLKSGKINAGLGWVEQAEEALDWAKDKSRANPQPKTVNPKGKHQVTPAANGPKKLSFEEFKKKHGGSEVKLANWIEYNESGKVPQTA